MVRSGTRTSTFKPPFVKAFMTSLPKIAIIGAGPAGLTLARLLHVSLPSLKIAIYELDASPTSRPDQGGTLDLHTETGLAAIKKCLLWDEFLKYARYDGEELKISDKNATILVHMKAGANRNRPEIDREKLKGILFAGVPREWVRWGRKLRSVNEEGRLRFDINGKEEVEGPFDLVVGADGAWSKVRDRLSGIKPVYSGVSGYEMVIQEPAKMCPDVNTFVGRGGFFGSSDRKCLNAQRMGDDSLKVRSWYLSPEGRAKEDLEKFGKEKTLEIIKERYNDWAPEITEFLRQGDLQGLKQWTLYELPVGHQWEHKEGFTLIGDAASLSTPFSGEGVNKAMKDALELAELIEKSQDIDKNLTLDQAVKLYEQEMFPRARKLQETTMMNKQNVFGPAAPIGIITGFLKIIAKDSSSIPMKVLGTRPFLAAVHSYFWILQQAGWALRSFWRRR